MNIIQLKSTAYILLCLQQAFYSDLPSSQWVDEYEIKSVAVERKGSASPKSLMEAALTQACEYQLFFPYVYLAAPNIKSGSLTEALGPLRLGLFMYDGSDFSNILDAKVSSRLDCDEFLYKVRQVAAGILSFKEVLDEPSINMPKPGELHCYTTEPSNFLLTNHSSDNNYYFGINLEKQDNVRKLKEVSRQTLFESITNISDDYWIGVDYIETYKPPISWNLMNVRVRDLSQEDVYWLMEYSKEKNYKTRLVICKEVWDEDEVLSYEKHKKRIENTVEELRPIKR